MRVDGDAMLDRFDNGEPLRDAEEARACAPYLRIFASVRDQAHVEPPPGWEARARQRLRAYRWRQLAVHVVAAVALGLALALVAGCETRERPERPELRELRELRARIQTACTGAARQATLTLRALDRDPNVGLLLALHDASYVQLCGGDHASVGDPALLGDVDATRAAVLALRERWLGRTPSNE